MLWLRPASAAGLPLARAEGYVAGGDGPFAKERGPGHRR